MPPVVERPLNEAELVGVAKQAAAAGRPVVVGRAPHPGDPVRIDLSGYGRLLRVDRDNGLATVEAGVSLRVLSQSLASWGLSLENGGRDPGQALGAAVSVGAHGTGARYGGVATQVTALRLVTPGGAVVTCSAEEEPDIFDAARVGLGALGVISTLTVRCQSGFNLRVERRAAPFPRVLAAFDSWADGNEYFQLSWLPGRPDVRVTTANRTIERPDGRAVDRGYRWFNRWRFPRKQVEDSFARDEAGPALQRASERSAAQRWGLPFPILVSVSAGDEIPLSPAQGRPSLFIAGVAGLGGRPCWGAGRGDPARYPRFAEWQAVRDRLDPDRRFAYSSGQG